jgi:hypothetical protein
VLEVAKLLVRMEARGYRMRILAKKLHRHIHRFYCFIGTVGPHALLTEVWNMVDELQAIRAEGGSWEHYAAESLSASEPMEVDDESGASGFSMESEDSAELLEWED